MNQKFKKYFPPLIGILAVFAVWYIVCRAGILSSYVLPSPGRVFQSFCKMLQSGELFRDLRISFVRVGKGFVIALSWHSPSACCGRWFLLPQAIMSIWCSSSGTCRRSA